MFRKLVNAYVKRPLKNYNVVPRAEKVISQEKLVAAPKFREDDNDHLTEEGNCN